MCVRKDCNNRAFTIKPRKCDSAWFGVSHISISLNILFLAVTLLAVVWYVVPFVWSVFVTKAKVRVPKQKETKKEIEEK